MKAAKVSDLIRGGDIDNPSPKPSRRELARRINVLTRILEDLLERQGLYVGEQATPKGIRAVVCDQPYPLFVELTPTPKESES